MSNFVPIERLNFGYNDAAVFRQSGELELQQKLFLGDDQLKKLTEPTTFFLVGDKGTGKTAYATFLTNFKHNETSGVITFVQSPDFKSFVRIAKALGIESDEFRHLWESILLVIMLTEASAIGSIRSHANSKTPALSILKSLSDMALGSFQPSVSTTLSILQDLSLFAERVIEKGKDENAKRMIGDFSGSSIRILHHLRNILIDALDEVEISGRFILFVDGIDVRPPDVEYEDYLACVRGLIHAGWELNSERLQKKEDRKFRVVLLLRPDILDSAGLQNLNNKLRDNSVILNWYTTYQAHRGSSLFRLVDNLFRGQQENPDQLGLGQAWDQYFPASEWQQREGSKEAFIELMRDSFYRPRDFVTMLKFFQEEHIKEEQGSEDTFSIRLCKRHSVRGKFSEYLLGEIKNSLEFYYRAEDFELVYKFFDEFLRARLDRFNFDYQGFLESYGELCEYMERNKVEIPVIFSTADRFLQFLYELNVICFIEEDPNKNRSNYRWSYREKNSSTIRPKVKSNKRYNIHYGIGMALYNIVPGGS